MFAFMKRLIPILLIIILAIPAEASEWEPPEVTGEASALMPSETDSFASGIWYILCGAVKQLMPSLTECAGICMSVMAGCMLLSFIRSFKGPGGLAVQLCGIVCIACILLKPAHSMIELGMQTVESLSEYSKLLMPVLTAALAAQGGTSSSMALYAATALLDTVFMKIVTVVVTPMVYIYLALCIVNAALQDDTIAALRNQTKALLITGLKICLYVFTGYVSITGVVCGTVDASAVKAAKLTISSAVPVVGSILADASESILVSAAVVRNAVGIYGLMAVIAIVVMPFLKIAIQYGLMKITSSISAMFADKPLIGLLNDYCSAMGILLGITGSVSLMMLISIVCFLKGMS